MQTTVELIKIANVAILWLLTKSGFANHEKIYIAWSLFQISIENDCIYIVTLITVMKSYQWTKTIFELTFIIIQNKRIFYMYGNISILLMYKKKTTRVRREITSAMVSNKWIHICVLYIVIYCMRMVLEIMGNLFRDHVRCGIRSCSIFLHSFLNLSFNQVLRSSHGSLWPQDSCVSFTKEHCKKGEKMKRKRKK